MEDVATENVPSAATVSTSPSVDPAAAADVSSDIQEAKSDRVELRLANRTSEVAVLLLIADEQKQRILIRGPSLR